MIKCDTWLKKERTYTLGPLNVEEMSYMELDYIVIPSSGFHAIITILQFFVDKKNLLQHTMYYWYSS